MAHTYDTWSEALGPSVPGPVGTLLDRVFSGDERIRAVIVHGSTGRDEFSVLEAPDGPLVLSDVEAVVVVDRESDVGSVRRDVDARLDAHRAERPRGPFFSVDYSVVSPRRLETLPLWWITYEKRHGSRVVGDRSVLDAIPKVTPDTIDLRESNETIVWRLLHLLVNRPAGIEDMAQLDETGRAVWRYLALRDALDVTTWLCPHLGLMEVGFERRVAALRAHASWPRVLDAYGADLGDVFDRALTAKRLPGDGPDPQDRVVDLLTTAFRAITEGGPGAGLLRSGGKSGPFLGMTSLRRLIHTGKAWAESPKRAAVGLRGMEELGSAVVALHEEAATGAASEALAWRDRVERLLRSTGGFLPGAETRIDRYREIQDWWEGRHV